MSKIERDHELWNATPPEMPVGWTRYPVSPYAEEPWDVIPDYVEEERLIIMTEYRPSSIMGYGIAAFWVGPKERKSDEIHCR